MASSAGWLMLKGPQEIACKGKACGALSNCQINSVFQPCEDLHALCAEGLLLHSLLCLLLLSTEASI